MARNPLHPSDTSWITLKSTYSVERNALSSRQKRSFITSEASVSTNKILTKQITDKLEIEVGAPLPYGPRMYHKTMENIIRMRDIGMNKRIIVVGVLGSFTPDCWNRHLYLVLKYYEYYKERGVNYICCISTNDPYVHTAWGSLIGCEDKVLMLSDPKSHYTSALGMSVIVPWVDSSVRSRRYVLLADDMIVTKMIKSDKDLGVTRWDCDHLLMEEEEDQDSNIDLEI